LQGASVSHAGAALTDAVVGLVVAAGRGERLGGDLPKALRSFGGRPMLAWAVDALKPVCGQVVVVGPPTRLAEVAAAVPDVIVVPGGATRGASVRCGLAALDPLPRYVLVHDAARPMAPTSLAERVLAALIDGARAVVPVLPLADTVKQVDSDGLVVSTPDRTSLRIVQTPQGFCAALLVAAHRDEVEATDDAALVEALGAPVHTVPGDPRAAKVTTPADLVLLELGRR